LRKFDLQGGAKASDKEKKEVIGIGEDKEIVG